MKGDFTRSTFQPNKHYTSVRMQQGRLQLDSDWNEQVDIEAYLRHAQAVDMIGADSGVPTSEGDSAEPYRDSFKISVTPDGSDLAIAPGRLYVSGTFCELEATPFTGTFVASNRIKVTTLIVDGRQLEKNQWIEIEPDNNPDLKTSVQIESVNNQTLEITLNIELEKIKKNVLKVKEYTEKGKDKIQALRLRRVVTYNTQSDYINPEEALKQDTTIYLAYVDVWQRHITAIEDPTIREVALNGSDTTTRTQTIWQIKLKKLDELIKEVGGEAEDKNAFPENKQLNNLNDPDWESLIQKVWGKFLTQQEQRQALMNACAKLCSSSGSQSNGSGYQRLENLLYRVEIYEPSQTEQGENQGNNRTNKATFKWSRDNGSVVSPIEKIEGNVITIRKSSQDAWMSSRAGQWLEITNEEMELKGQPGVMVPLSRVSDSKIEFNDSRIVNGPIPNNSTKVRLWSHDVKKYPNGAVPIADDWIELEPGIKVKFYKDSDYRTGDYWLIPARNATNDIEWPHNQAELQKRQPLPQPPKGIHHDYCPLALIQFEGQVNAEEDKSEQEEPEEEPKNIRDLRVIFPPLMRCLDKAGGVITGTLEVQSDLYVTGRYQKQVDRYVDGKVGIGTKQPFARLHTKAAKLLPGQEQITSHEQQINLHEASNFTTKFHEGDLLKVDGQERIITQVEDKFLTINETLEITEPKSFEYQQPIARLENSDGNPQFVVLANGNTGIGTPTPYNQLDVVGGVAIGQAYAGKTKAPDNGLLVDGTVSIGSTLPPGVTNFKLYVNGNIKGNSFTAKSGIFRSQEGANLSFQTGDTTRISVFNSTGNVSIGSSDDAGVKLFVDGDIQGKRLRVQSGAVTSLNNQNLSLQTNETPQLTIFQSTGNVSIGSANDAGVKLFVGGAIQGERLRVQSGAVTSLNNQNLSLQTNETPQLTIFQSTGNVSIGSANDAGVKLFVGGTIQCERLRVQSGAVTSLNNQNLSLQTNETPQLTIFQSTGNVSIGSANDAGVKLFVGGAIQGEHLSVQSGVVGNLNVINGNVALGLTQSNQSVNIGFQDSQLNFIGRELEGYSFDQPITAQQGIVTNRIENQDKNKSLVLQTNDQDRIAITPDGKISIGDTGTKNAQLHLNGTFQVKAAQNALAVSLTPNNEADFSSALQLARNNQSVHLGFQNQNFVLRTNDQDFQDFIAIAPNTGNIGIGLDPDADAKLHVGGALKLVTNEKFVSIAPQSDDWLHFITDLNGYSFNKKLKIGYNQTAQTAMLAINGYVGIGTQNPTHKLHVNGGIVKISQDEKTEGKYLEIGEQRPFAKGKENFIQCEFNTNSSQYSFNKPIAVEGEIISDRLELKADKESSATISYKNGSVIIDGSTPSANDPANLNLYVNGKLYVKEIATESSDSETVKSSRVESKGFYQVSSRAIKEDINDLSSHEVAAILRALNPVKFIYTEDESKTPHAGFIAEDTPDFLTVNGKQAIKVVDIVAVLTKVVQDHRKTLTDLVKVVKKQQSEIATLTQKLQELEEKKEP